MDAELIKFLDDTLPNCKDEDTEEVDYLGFLTQKLDQAIEQQDWVLVGGINEIMKKMRELHYVCEPPSFGGALARMLVGLVDKP